MSGIAPQLRASPAPAGAPAAARVRRAALAVPLAVLVAGAALSAIDLRAGFLASAVVMGWTQLVGL
jgi:hypothetical protein